MAEVTFEPRSEWQKPECIFCEAPATQEAVYHFVLSGLNGTSRIRCCDKQTCRDLAAKMAVDSIPKQAAC